MVVRVVTHLQRDTLGHGDAAVFHLRHFRRIVGQQADGAKPHAFENFGTNPEVALVILKPESVVCLDCIKPLIL